MLELLSATKSNLHDIQTKSSPLKNNSREFEAHLDNSISNNKALKDEIENSNLTETKKELKKLRALIQEIKEKNSLEEGQSPEQINELMASLDNILSFLDKAIEQIENGELSSVENLNGWMQEMVSHLQNGMEDLSNKDMVALIHKASFILEDMNLFAKDLAPQTISQFENILGNLSEEFQTVLQKTDANTQQVAHQSEGAIEIDSSFEVMESAENLESSEIGDESLDTTMASSEFTQDSDGNSGDSSKAEIVDLRKQKTSDQTVVTSEPFSLEQIDNATKATENNILVNAKPIKNEMLIAERTYSSFSSAVTRVQVEALMQNVTGKLSVILQDGGNELRMKLTPPELGNMKLSFISEDGVMRGKIVVETPEAKMFFEQNINNLRESLANAGLDLGSVDIDLGSGEEFAQADQEQAGGIQAARPLVPSSEKIQESSLVSPDVIIDFTA